jgi:hypothetical protein
MDHIVEGDFVGDGPYVVGYAPYLNKWGWHSYGGGFHDIPRESQMQLRYGRYWQNMNPCQKFGSPTGDIWMSQPLHKHQLNPFHPSRAREIVRKKKFKKIAKETKETKLGCDDECCQAC